MTLKDAFNKALLGQYIKCRGDSFSSNVGYYYKRDSSTLDYVVGGAGYTYKGAKLHDLLNNCTIDYYDVYRNQSEFSKVE